MKLKDIFSSSTSNKAKTVAEALNPSVKNLETAYLTELDTKITAETLAEIALENREELLERIEAAARKAMTNSIKARQHGYRTRTTKTVSRKFSKEGLNNAGRKALTNYRKRKRLEVTGNATVL